MIQIILNSCHLKHSNLSPSDPFHMEFTANPPHIKMVYTMKPQNTIKDAEHWEYMWPVLHALEIFYGEDFTVIITPADKLQKQDWKKNKPNAMAMKVQKNFNG